MARRVLGAVERFLAVEAASGWLLMGAACVALLWANSPWRGSYVALWRIPIAFGVGSWTFARDAQFWINDGLMTAFFFVAGLEIRREIAHGELSQPRRAALPVVAALGGMMVPAAIYMVINHGHPGAHGWGTPMATDIAFAVGVLALLGRRVAPALRVLLLALAIIDDVGAIVVIALFYSSSLSVAGLWIAAAGIAGVFGLRAVGVRSPWAYVLPGVVLWAGTYRAGLHPTLSGVVLGLLTPVTVPPRPAAVVEPAPAAKASALAGPHQDAPTGLREDLAAVVQTRGDIGSPAERIQHALHAWVAFGVMPLFALANAGVAFGHSALHGDTLRVGLGVTLGLALGKPVGIVAFSLAARRFGIVVFPAGLRLRQLLVVGVVAGVGFTMALFTAQLGLPPGPLRETAKLAIVVGSVLSTVAALAVGRGLKRAEQGERIAESESEAESSDAA